MSHHALMCRLMLDVSATVGTKWQEMVARPYPSTNPLKGPTRKGGDCKSPVGLIMASACSRGGGSGGGRGRKRRGKESSQRGAGEKGWGRGRGMWSSQPGVWR